MVPEIDTRDFGFLRARREDLESAAAAPEVDQPVEIAGWNPLTGTPRKLIFKDSPPQEKNRDSLAAFALAQIRRFAAQLGLVGDGSPEFRLLSRMQRTSSGACILHFQQYRLGIVVKDMIRTAVFDPQGRLVSISGDNIGLQALSTEPRYSEQIALSAAAKHILDAQPSPAYGVENPPSSVEMSGSNQSFQSKVIASLPHRNRTDRRAVVFDKGVFAQNIPAELVFFHQGHQTRLGWQMEFVLPNLFEAYTIIVAADGESSDILYCTNSCDYCSVPIKGEVYLSNPDLTPRQEVAFPRPESDYPFQKIPGFPRPWLMGLELAGNNVTVYADKARKIVPRLRGITSSGISFAPHLTLERESQEYLNAFYFCNFMHDFFYYLGFDEEAGCLQHYNFPASLPGGGDALELFVLGENDKPGHIHKQPDGELVQIGLYRFPGTRHHAALDADIVFHEYTHAVTRRLAGATSTPQSDGMNEGWSDYFALTIQRYWFPNKEPVFGSWIYGDGSPLVRDYRSISKTFQDLPFFHEPHAMGEVWCGALMHMNQEICDLLDNDKKGHQLGWQLVINGMQHRPESYLEGRDVIFEELLYMKEHQQDQALGQPWTEDIYKELQGAIWTAFARFGMGPGAYSHGGSLIDIREDKSVPREDT